MMYQGLTERFVDLLQLKQPPVGLAFVEGVPENVAHTSRRAPSACTFWRLAEQGVFYANAQELMLRFLDAPNLGGIQRFAQEFIS